MFKPSGQDDSYSREIKPGAKVKRREGVNEVKKVTGPGVGAED